MTSIPVKLQTLKTRTFSSRFTCLAPLFLPDAQRNQKCLSTLTIFSTSTSVPIMSSSVVTITTAALIMTMPSWITTPMLFPPKKNQQNEQKYPLRIPKRIRPRFPFRLIFFYRNMYWFTQLHNRFLTPIINKSNVLMKQFISVTGNGIKSLPSRIVLLSQYKLKWIEVV